MMKLSPLVSCHFAFVVGTGQHVKEATDRLLSYNEHVPMKYMKRARMWSS